MAPGQGGEEGEDDGCRRRGEGVGRGREAGVRARQGPQGPGHRQPQPRRAGEYESSSPAAKLKPPANPYGFAPVIVAMIG
jgi:hypothetical protein